MLTFNFVVLRYNSQGIFGLVYHNAKKPDDARILALRHC